jgi:beta-lactamase regulating signal transducer with metallopeptidase domain
MQIDFVPQLVNAAIRSFALSLAIFAVLSLFRIRSSDARHAMWTIVLAGMLLQIPISVVAPTVALRALPTLSAPVSTRARQSERISLPAAQALVTANRTRAMSKGRQLPSDRTITGIYLAISILLLVRMALGSLGLRRILREAKPVPDLGPGVFESRLLVAPGSVGCRRARILLPSAWKDWDALKLRSVLLHERAHIRRRDWLIRVASHLNVCIFWFHPLAWWLERELARLAEEACDDVALAEMEDREGYAATLVDLAHAVAAGHSVLNRWVMSMAKESNVGRRVNRILDRSIQVPKPFGRLAWLSLFSLGLPLIYLSAAVKLASPNPEPTVLPHSAVRSHPDLTARQPLLPAQKSPVRLIAQAAPNQAPRTPPPLARSPREEAPISICILIDNSGSTRDKRAAMKAAALALVKASRPRDEVCIVNFNDEASNGLAHGEDFTSDVREMEEALTHMDSRGGSAMRDAIRMSIDHVQRAAHNGRKVLVLVTDGNDNSSTVTQEQLLGEIKNSGVLLYSIGLLSEDHPRQAGAARLALRQFAEVSGGRDYYPKDLAEVEGISPEIANELRRR